ncbi:hypothetical protein GCM10027516_24380 [Niabella aquatica]
MGFDTTQISETDSFYTVEGDILINKNLLRRTSPRQASIRDTASISLLNQRGITVFIDPSIPNNSSPDNWRPAIANALQNFNNINSNLKFALVSTLPADVIFRQGLSTEFSSSGTIAKALFPHSGIVGGLVIVNFNYSSYSTSQKEYILTHEIGHLVGLRHTNWYGKEPQNDIVDGVSVGAYTIGASPSGSDPDPNSVFNKYYNNQSWSSTSGFSSWDIYAIQYLYPINKPNIVGNAITCGTDSYTASYIPNGSSIIWSVNSSVSTLSCTNCNSTTLTTSGGYTPTLSMILSKGGINFDTLNKEIVNPNYPDYNVPLTGETALQTNTVYSFYANTSIYKGIKSFPATWSYPSNWTKITGGDGTYIVLRTPNTKSPITGSIVATLQTDCGTTTMASKWFYFP